MRNSGFFKLIIVAIVAIGAFTMFNQAQTSVVNSCKVIKLQQQNLIHSDGDNGGVSTEIRYLVVTDKETFICESSLLNGKFNNSDIFFRLKEDSTYDFKVAGIGKSFVSDYRNILEVVK